MREMLIAYPGASQLRYDIKESKPKFHGNQTISVGSGSMLDLLPPRNIVDRHINLYLDSFETFYRVLHVPSFREQYKQFWDVPGQAKLDFVVIVRLMVAATSCIDNQKYRSSNLDSSLARNAACEWIAACEAWLQQQSQKHVTLLYMQVQCILHIAKQMQSYKAKRTWTAAGTLMSLAISKGTHRNADILNQQQRGDDARRVSIFDQEMRRRLWSTIAEMEMQSALERGMPSCLPDLNVDCGAPTNCHDASFSPMTETRLSSQPMVYFTRSSYQCYISKSWHLRQRTLSLINGKFSPNFQETQELDQAILQALDDIPAWDSQEAVLPSSLLQLQFYQLLLWLHQVNDNSESDQSKYNYSKLMHVRAAKAIIDIHEALCTKGHQVLTILRQDVLSAALSICYDHEMAKTIGKAFNLCIPYFDTDAPRSNFGARGLIPKRGRSSKIPREGRANTCGQDSNH